VTAYRVYGLSTQTIERQNADLARRIEAGLPELAPEHTYRIKTGGTSYTIRSRKTLAAMLEEYSQSFPGTGTVLSTDKTGSVIRPGGSIVLSVVRES
jgi:hypothetical protein